MVCNDNLYGFIFNDKLVSILSIFGVKEVVLELNFLLKLYNMVGWWVGMLGGVVDYLSMILCFKSNMDLGMFCLL